MNLDPAVEEILYLSRWAPSGDNAQPWSFEPTGPSSLNLHIHHQRDNVYEYNAGEPTLISAGALLENLSIAGSAKQKALSWGVSSQEREGDRLSIALRFEDDAQVPSDPLASQIQRRAVDRRPYKLRQLTSSEKAALSRAVLPYCRVEWRDGLLDRWQLANLCRRATDIRLRIPETFEVHNRIVDWERRESPTGIPAQALGLDALTLRLMRWSLATRSRTRLANLLGSPFFASLQMDIVPGILNSAYFTFRVERADGFVTRNVQMLEVGRAVQRFWLTASQLGLAMQPCLAVLAFTRYGAIGTPFTSLARGRAAAVALAAASKNALGNLDEIVFLGRIGEERGPLPARSTRMPLEFGCRMVGMRSERSKGAEPVN